MGVLRMGKTSRIYSYRASAPVKNKRVVEKQLRLTHRFRNWHARLETLHRRKCHAVARRLHPDLIEYDARIAYCRWRCDQLRDQTVQENIKRQSRDPRPQRRLTISMLQKRIRTLQYEARKLERKVLRDHPAERKAVFALRTEEEKRMRQDIQDEGLFWPSYSSVERVEVRAFRNWKQTPTPPDQKVWDGQSRIAVRTTTGPHTEEDLLTENRWLWMERVPGGIRVETDRHRRTKADPEVETTPKRLIGDTWLWFRVGSTSDRKPVWAKIPFYYSRPLPEGAKVQWCWIRRERVGRQYRWRVQFVLSAESREPFLDSDLADVGAVGIDIGWRRFDGEGLRVAVWAGSDGKEGELRLPEWWIREMETVERIQSHRDRIFNRCTSWLYRIRKRLPGPLRDEVSHAYAWRDKKRLRALCWCWEAVGTGWPEGVYGPPDIAVLRSWKAREDHLEAYERNLHDQLQASRKHLYRVWVARLAERYAEAYIEDFDLRTFHRRLPPEYGGTFERDAAREYIRHAALYSWREAVKSRFRETVEVPAANTTLQCHACCVVEDEHGWPDDERQRLHHKCSHCGCVWDQDINAARNLLGLSGQAPEFMLAPLGPLPVTTFEGQSGSPVLRETICSLYDKSLAGA